MGPSSLQSTAPQERQDRVLLNLMQSSSSVSASSQLLSCFSSNHANLH